MDDLGKMLGGLAVARGGRGVATSRARSAASWVARVGSQGLVDTLGKGGLADVAQSWIGTGPNRHVEPAALARRWGPTR